MSNRTLVITAAVTLVLAISAFGAMKKTAAGKPPASEFGPGPRLSANGLYLVSLQGAKELRPRKMYTLQVFVANAETRPLADAVIAIDGGMPQHGHGLPTRPRVTKVLGSGWYEISGLRFNMGGWWELELT